jgi:hypothetical protein
MARQDAAVFSNTASQVSAAQTSAATDSPFKTDFLRTKLFLFHALIVAYVTFGWMAETRLALFVYIMVLPLIGMQWLFNRGSSVINNWESRLRTGHWRDTRNPYEGRFFVGVINNLGVPATPAQVNTVVIFAMLMFWLAGLFRMMIFLA